jgi:hypothetical protein
LIRGDQHKQPTARIGGRSWLSSGCKKALDRGDFG